MITILGTGQVGRAIVEQLQSTQPHLELLLVNRSGKAPFALPAGGQVVSTDVTDPARLIEIFQKSRLVFSCTDVPYPQWHDFYPALSNAMIQGLKQSDAHLIFADNMYSYGNLAGQTLHEELPHAATTKKGKIRAALVENFASNGVQNRVAIVKSSDFIGPRIEKGLFGVDFLQRIHHNKMVYLPGNVELPHHFTFIEDFARAMLRVASDEQAFGQSWHVPNALAVSPRKWIELFEEHTRLPIRYRAIPRVVVQLGGWFDPFLRELDELAYQFEHPYLVSAQKFIDRFGDISTPHFEIIKRTLAWFAQHNSGN